MFTPARIRGTETLDDPSTDPTLALRSLRDVALSNRLFGGRRAVVLEVRAILCALPSGAAHPHRAMSLLDIGTGLGDIPQAAQRMARRLHRPLSTIGAEIVPELAHAARSACDHAVAADAQRLPFADASIDIVTCSQVLHHFEGADAEQLLRECSRVARTAVIVGEIRRSWWAFAGLWLSSYALGFHPVSRHDGMVSIRRGYTRVELHDLVARATGCRIMTRTRRGFRLVAVWSPRSATPA